MKYPQTEEERIKLAHPYYKIMELNKETLLKELASWSRTELIEWLCWNDRNGVYKDQERIDEGGDPMDRDYALETMTRQILQEDE
ncbi:hypothetical protein EAX61_05700 [Dokdonia sinensis]|uniref:Uncharacterized protein n=1 Tax=Dokdonia sinensis TaxID=2479847 RepID=A0A3M0G7N5_9FLAO|nr:hypothetical protein [Dokdonia sinensis]RMB60975.1 hypothetical protein EAX61_05700 [Dokdonia sinensis]